jgi:hypothetical protein
MKEEIGQMITKRLLTTDLINGRPDQPVERFYRWA